MNNFWSRDPLPTLASQMPPRCTPDAPQVHPRVEIRKSKSRKFFKNQLKWVQEGPFRVLRPPSGSKLRSESIGMPPGPQNGHKKLKNHKKGQKLRKSMMFHISRIFPIFPVWALFAVWGHRWDHICIYIYICI